MKKSIKKLSLFLVLPVIFLILSGCGKQNLTNSPNNNAPAKINQTLTVAMVAQHNTPTNCWQIIDGQVYDLTSYIASGKHPNNKINDGCGQDASAMFAAIAKHNGKAQAMLPDYLLGAVQQ